MKSMKKITLSDGQKVQKYFKINICKKIFRDLVCKEDFLVKLSRSLDAARAVDAAYAYKERQIKFGKLVKLTQNIRKCENKALVTVRQFKTDYRLKVKLLKNMRVAKIGTKFSKIFQEP